MKWKEQDMAKGPSLIQCSRCKEHSLQVEDVLEPADEILQQGGCPREVHPHKVDICAACLAKEGPAVQAATTAARERRRYLRVCA